MTDPIPKDLWIGKIQGQSPLYTFASENEVTNWLQQPPGYRRAWKVTAITLAEVELVPPIPASLRMVEIDEAS